MTFVVFSHGDVTNKTEKNRGRWKEGEKKKSAEGMSCFVRELTQ